MPFHNHGLGYRIWQWAAEATSKLSVKCETYNSIGKPPAIYVQKYLVRVNS